MLYIKYVTIKKDYIFKINWNPNLETVGVRPIIVIEESELMVLVLLTWNWTVIKKG